MANGKAINKLSPAPDISKNLKTLLDQAIKKAEDFNPEKELGTTRSKIAVTFVRWYFYLLGGTLIFIVLYNLVMLHYAQPQLILEPKDLLLVITTAIGSPLGFVIGYYFKDSE